MKKWTVYLLTACLLTGSCRAWELSAGSAALYDCLTGEILWERNGDQIRGMASTTKIMTALTALKLYSPDETVVIQPEWTGIEGSSMYLQPGERVTVRDLLYGLMLMSGNDAAAALAGLHPDGPEGFVAEMNRRAREMGLSHTAFCNPSGLDAPGHHTTARELAKLAGEALKQPEFAKIAATKTVTAAGRLMHNHNRLLFTLPSCIGVKTGYTRRCGRCLVSAIEQQGRRFVLATLDDRQDWQDHTALWQSLQDAAETRQLVSEGLAAAVPLVGGALQSVGLCSREGLSLPMLPSDQWKVQIACAPFLYAPVKAGEIAGEMRVLINGREVFRTLLYTAQDAAAAEPPGLWRKIQIWFESR